MRVFSIHSSTMRRFGALMACLLWLAGFEIVPQLHTAFHADAGHHHHEGASEHHETQNPGHGHDHDADEPEHHAHADHHAHDAGAHEHEHDDAESLDGLDELDRLDALDELELQRLDEQERLAADHHHAAERSTDDNSPSVDLGVAQHEPAPDNALLAAQLRDTPADSTALKCPADNGHGAHTLAHRGVVAMSTPPAWPPIDAAAFRYIAGPSAHQLQPPMRRLHRVRARGPPVGSA